MKRPAAIHDPHVSTELGALPQSVLAPGAARRVSNQLGRAFRGTYGAKAGLDTIVRSLAHPLLARGTPPDAVIRSLEALVLEHPERLAGDPRRIGTGEALSTTLIELIRQSVAGAAEEQRRSA
jgi:hypothetical protein